MKKENKTIRIAYGGGRDISVEILKFILKYKIKPLALILENKKLNRYDKKLISLCNYLDDSHILKGNQFCSEKGLKLLRNLDLDYIICVHFPLIIPKECLDVPKQGVINSHPAYLPYNRGWHTPSWAILKDTPYGASLHFMNENIDAGDIIRQKKIKILATDTAHTLYQRVLKLEVENFKQAWPDLVSKTYKRIPQNSNQASYHKKKDFQSIQFIDLNKKIEVGNLIKQLRALTTNNPQEAAYFEEDGKLYHLQIHITQKTTKKTLDNLLINKEFSIKEAMKIIDQAGWGVGFVIDESKKFFGIVTDGDIRKAILKGIDIVKNSVGEICNKKPIVVHEKTKQAELIRLKTRKDIKEKMPVGGSLKIPVIDVQGKIKDIAFIYEETIKGNNK